MFVCRTQHVTCGSASNYPPPQGWAMSFDTCMFVCRTCYITCASAPTSPPPLGWLIFVTISGVLQDTPRNMRFSINFFTSIGLGGLTDRMREHLKNLPRLIATQQAQQASSDSSSSSSDTGTLTTTPLTSLALVILCPRQQQRVSGVVSATVWDKNSSTCCRGNPAGSQPACQHASTYRVMFK